MADPPCEYDCANEPSTFRADPDISGIGWIIACVASAGTAVGILVLNYLFIYDPCLDCFDGSQDGHQVTHNERGRPNRIDMFLLLPFRRRLRKYTGAPLRRFIRIFHNKHRRRGGVECPFSTTSGSSTPSNNGNNDLKQPVISIIPRGSTSTQGSASTRLSSSQKPQRLPQSINATTNSLLPCEFEPVDVKAGQRDWQRCFDKCIVAMSDCQTVTSFSILVSGFANMKCGISAYHWQTIVYLTWFTTLTNFACLTFLRGYLHRHPIQRHLRLFAMTVIVFMLMIAIVPTGNYAWMRHIDPYGDYTAKTLAERGINDFARCHVFWEQISSSDRSHREAMRYVRLNTAFALTVLLVASLSRGVLLYRCLSRGLLSRLQRVTSSSMRTLLLKLWTRWDVQRNPDSFKCRLLYHPMLACFFTSRVLLDLAVSVFLEVWWLVVSYAIGVVRIFSLRRAQEQGKQGSTRWSFGQVFAVVLLAAPFLTVIQFMLSKSKEDRRMPATVSNHVNLDRNATAQNDVLPTLPPSPPSRAVQEPHDQTAHTAVAEACLSTKGLVDHPDHGFSKVSSSCALAQLLAVTTVWIYSSRFVAFSFGFGSANVLLDLLRPDTGGWCGFFTWPPLHILMCLTHIILWSFLIECKIRDVPIVALKGCLGTTYRDQANLILFLSMFAATVCNVVRPDWSARLVVVVALSYWPASILLCAKKRWIGAQ